MKSCSMALHDVTCYIALQHGTAWCYMPQCRDAWHCVMLHATVPWCMALHDATCHSALLHSTAWCYMPQWRDAWHCMMLHVPVPCCMSLHDATCHSAVLHGTAWSNIFQRGATQFNATLNNKDDGLQHGNMALYSFMKCSCYMTIMIHVVTLACCMVNYWCCMMLHYAAGNLDLEAMRYLMQQRLQ